ncbi:hypothetical protein C8J57DRAFT_1315149 [Mycena rebaudengoi]|nr:hypothetical protein C8J57DRAFT_1315149 [Mycena rebaudengoi]
MSTGTPLGYATHAQHATSRLVFLEHTLRGNTLAPPNNNIYPPGPAWLRMSIARGCRLWLGMAGILLEPTRELKSPLAACKDVCIGWYCTLIKYTA